MPPNAQLRHLDHRSPQDGDHRLDRRPDRGRNDRGRGRLGLQRRIQAAGFRLQGSLRPARRQVPGPVRRQRADRLQGRGRGRSAGREEGDDGGLRGNRKVPPRQRSRQPLREGRRGRGQRRRRNRLRDDPVRRRRQQARQREDAGNHRDRPEARGRRPAGRARRQPDRRSRTGRRRLLLRHRPAGGDGDPAADLRLGGGDGTAADHDAVRARGRDQPGHDQHPRLRHGQLRAGPGGDDRPRRRDRLRALHPHPLPQRPRRRAGAARGGDRRRRHRRPRRPLRRDHRDHRPAGHVPARPHLPLRGGDGGGAGGAVHDDRGADPAAGAADDRRPPGRQAAHPRPRQPRRDQPRQDQVVPLEPRDPAPALAGGQPLRRPPDPPLRPHPLAAARHQRRRHRTAEQNDPPVLRPAGARASAPASTAPS